MNEHRSMSVADAADLLLLGALWGGSFLFMRVAAPEFGPIALIALRVGIGALFLVPVLLLKGGAAELRPNAGPLFLVGVLNAALPFTLLAYATLSLTAGFAAVMNSTAPFFSALVGWLWLKDRMSASRVAGLLVGFLGVLVLVWDKASFKPGGSGLALLAATGATLLYGVSANYTKTRLAGVNPLAVAAGSQIGAALFLLPFALLAAPSAMPSAKAWCMVAALGVLSTGIAFILYFRLIANIGATRAIAVTFLIPVFGMLWGRLALSEPVTASMLAGTAVILIGTSLTTGLASAALGASRRFSL